VLNFLSDNTAIVTLLLLTLLVLLLLAVIVWAALKGGEKPELAAERKPRMISADSLKQSFRSAVELIESNLATRSERYNLSWTLILNEGQGGRELPLVQSGLPSALSADSTLTAAAQGIGWNFFDKGVAVQLQADHLGASDPDAPGANNTWDDFLGLCRNYRPERPFDAIVIAIPASVFLRGDSQGQLDLAARAKAIHRRLWLAQNRLALRFPVYLTITDCESIPGFAAFAAALPEPMRRSILGWSSPYELVAPFQGQWVDAAMNEVVRALSDSCSELCALEAADSDSRAYFMLPNEVERLRAGLKLFAEELMRPSAYHEPFLLRGIYLTGDCSDAAALLGRIHDAPAQLEAGADMAADAAQAEAPLALVAGQSNAMPAFLRDIFERKIFAEVGLVRSSAVQGMRRPALGRALRVAAIVVPLVWLLGMGWSAARLHRLAGELVTYLERLDHDSRLSVEESNGNVLDVARGRKRALDALTNIQQMDAARLSSPFMPGSWPLFDDLHQRVRARLEKGFAENSFEPLRHAAYYQIGQLTGVAADPASGRLIVGASCSLPAGWNEQTAIHGAAALNIEDLPEFSATLQYVARIEELDRVLHALERLKSNDAPASGEDLALVVRVLLGADVNGNATRTAELFREVAKGAPALNIEPLRQAATCSLQLALKATYARLFAGNGLLKAEQAIGQGSTALLEGKAKSSDLAASIEVWQTLRMALHDEEAYFTPGKGGWMRRRGLQLGQAHDGLMQKIQSVSLLGTDVAGAAQKQAADNFTGFLAAWDASQSADSYVQGQSGGLLWSDTSSSWSFSADRKALLEALSALLSQPFMHMNNLARFPEVPAGSTVSWDHVRLDRALALADARKRFQTEALGKFPAMLQTPAAALADAALAETARDLLSQAFLVSSAEIQPPASEADRSRVLRLKAWLQELGAEGVADNLGAVLATDAMSRLQLLDRTFARAEVFVPSDQSFRSWKGEKVPLLVAFGAFDAANLGAYVSQQLTFIEASGKEAEGLLQQLGSVPAGNPVVERWQGVVADLNRYHLKSPTSNLLSLERFVLAGGADLDLANCLDRLSAGVAQRRASDVFAERLQMLQSGLYFRCRDLKQTEYQDAWTRFADAFNHDLSYRYPFRAAVLDPSDKHAALEHAFAEVDEVGATLKLFDRSHVLATAALRDQSRPGGSAAVRKADEQMQRVREFLAPLFPVEENQVAGLDLNVEFRANRGAEIDGNTIIDWILSVGPQTLRQRDPARALRWEPGMPIVFSLRVAQDGPVIPKVDPGRPGMSVEERTVHYRFDDPWALLTFIGAQRDTDAADARSQLLRFEFPQAISSDALGQAARQSRARVFLRLTVSAAGKRAPLAWPGAFPVRVPAW